MSVNTLEIGSDEHIKDILFKNDDKTQADVGILIEKFKDVKFFVEYKNKLTEDLFIKLLRALQFYKIKKNQILFRQGEKGTRYYIILKGSVHVMIKKKEKETVQMNKLEISKFRGLLNEYESRIYSPRKGIIQTTGTPLSLAALYTKSSILDGSKEKSVQHDFTRQSNIANPFNRQHKTFDIKRQATLSSSIPKKDETLEMCGSTIKLAKASLIPGFDMSAYDMDIKKLEEKKIEKKLKISRPMLKITWFVINSFIGTLKSDTEYVKKFPNFDIHEIKKFNVTWLENLQLTQLEDIYTDDLLYKLFPKWKNIIEIKKGGAFGEIALLKKVPRQATIYCSQDCEFATQVNNSGNNFDFLLGWEEREIKSFLSSFYGFNYWVSNDKVLELTGYLKKVGNKKLGDTIYKSGEKVNSIYLLQSGEVEFVFSKTNKGNLEGLLGSANKKSNNEYNNNDFRRVMKSNTIFGVEELLINSPYRIFSVISKSANCVYFEQSKDKLYIDLIQKNPNFQMDLSDYSCILNPALLRGFVIDYYDFYYERSKQSARKDVNELFKDYYDIYNNYYQKVIEFKKLCEAFKAKKAHINMENPEEETNYLNKYEQNHDERLKEYSKLELQSKNNVVSNENKKVYEEDLTIVNNQKNLLNAYISEKTKNISFTNWKNNLEASRQLPNSPEVKDTVISACSLLDYKVRLDRFNSQHCVKNVGFNENPHISNEDKQTYFIEKIETRKKSRADYRVNSKKSLLESIKKEPIASFSQFFLKKYQTNLNDNKHKRNATSRLSTSKEFSINNKSVKNQDVGHEMNHTTYKINTDAGKNANDLITNTSNNKKDVSKSIFNKIRRNKSLDCAKTTRNIYKSRISPGKNTEKTVFDQFEITDAEESSIKPENKTKTYFTPKNESQNEIDQIFEKNWISDIETQFRTQKSIKMDNYFSMRVAPKIDQNTKKVGFSVKFGKSTDRGTTNQETDPKTRSNSIPNLTNNQYTLNRVTVEKTSTSLLKTLTAGAFAFKPAHKILKRKDTISNHNSLSSRQTPKNKYELEINANAINNNFQNRTSRTEYFNSTLQSFRNTSKAESFRSPVYNVFQSAVSTNQFRKKKVENT